METDGILCSRNARPQKEGKGAARCPSCSQNAHDQNVLVRCAQYRTTLAAPLKNDEESPLQCFRSFIPRPDRFHDVD